MTKEIMITAGEVENGKTFRVGDLEFVKFYNDDNKVMVMTKNILFKSEYGANSDFTESEIFKKLEEVYIPELTQIVGEDNLLEFVTDLTSGDVTTEPRLMQSKMSIPTTTFYYKNMSVFEEYLVLYSFWLAASTCCDTYIGCVTPANTLVFECCQERKGVRTICALNPSLNVYVQVKEEKSDAAPVKLEDEKVEECTNEVQDKPEENDVYSDEEVRTQTKKHFKAQKEQEEKQMTNLTNLTANLSNLSEEDKALLFALIEKSKKPVLLSDIETGKPFRIGDFEFIKFGEEDGKIFAVTKGDIFDSKLENTINKDPILGRLEEEFLSEIIRKIGEENLIEFETDLLSIDGIDYGKFKSKVSLVTLDFYRKNRAIFNNYPLTKSFWLATYNGEYALSVPSTGVITYSTSRSSRAIRPIIALNPSTEVEPI